MTKKIKLYPSFLICFILFIAFGYFKQFAAFFVFTTLHELTHVLVGVKFKCRLRQISFMPFGEASVLEGLERLSKWRRIFVIISGPLLNICLATAFLMMGQIFGQEAGASNFNKLAEINLVLGLFNLLPVYPLDGGRLLHLVLGNNFGILRANKIMTEGGRIISRILILIGFIQVILYPFNVSLLSIGIYIKYINNRERTQMIYSFYDDLMNKSQKIQTNGYLPVKTMAVSCKITVADILSAFCWDYYHIIYIMEKDKIIRRLTEMEVIDIMLTHEVGKTLDKI